MIPSSTVDFPPLSLGTSTGSDLKGKPKRINNRACRDCSVLLEIDFTTNRLRRCVINICPVGQTAGRTT